VEGSPRPPSEKKRPGEPIPEAGNKSALKYFRLSLGQLRTSDRNICSKLLKKSKHTNKKKSRPVLSILGAAFSFLSP